MYVKRINQGDITNHFMQGRHKNSCVKYLSQSYYTTQKRLDLTVHIILFLKVLLNGRKNQYVMSMG